MATPLFFGFSFSSFIPFQGFRGGGGRLSSHLQYHLRLSPFYVLAAYNTLLRKS